MQGSSAVPQRVRRAGILGIGLDSGDGHMHITHGDEFLLVGGSIETHDLLRAKVAQFQAEVERRGKTLLDLTEAEIDEIAGLLE